MVALLQLLSSCKTAQSSCIIHNCTHAYNTFEESTLISAQVSLMAIKFNSEECCYDTIFTEELLTKCKKATE